MGLGETLKNMVTGGGLIGALSGIGRGAPNREDDVNARIAAAAQAGERLPSYKRGGVVRKTGPALLHKGETAGDQRVPQTGLFNVRKGTRVIPNRTSSRSRGR